MKVLATHAEFEAAIKTDKLVVVDFFATWCGPCKMIAPKLEDLDNKTPDVDFYKVDVDENEETAADQKITAMPTIKFYKGGQKVADVVGANFPEIERKVMELK